MRTEYRVQSINGDGACGGTFNGGGTDDGTVDDDIEDLDRAFLSGGPQRGSCSISSSSSNSSNSSSRLHDVTIYTIAAECQRQIPDGRL